MAKKILSVVESISEPIIDPVKSIKVKKIKKLGVEIQPVVLEAIVINDVLIKPKRILSDEQKEKMKIGRIKALELKKASK